MLPIKELPKINFFGLVVGVHLVNSSKKWRKKGAKTSIHGHGKAHSNQYQPNWGNLYLRVSPIKRLTIANGNCLILSDLGHSPLPRSMGWPPGAEKVKNFKPSRSTPPPGLGLGVNRYDPPWFRVWAIQALNQTEPNFLLTIEGGLLFRALMRDVITEVQEKENYGTVGCSLARVVAHLSLPSFSLLSLPPLRYKNIWGALCPD